MNMMSVHTFYNHFIPRIVQKTDMFCKTHNVLILLFFIVYIPYSFTRPRVCLPFVCKHLFVWPLLDIPQYSLQYPVTGSGLQTKKSE